jgi:hypothetical protein
LEGVSGKEEAASGVEPSEVATVLVEDATDDGSLQDQVGRSHVPRVGNECQHCGSERVRRVSHYAEGMSWWHEVLQIGIDHLGGVVAYLLPQPTGAPGMELHRDDSRASFQ